MLCRIVVNAPRGSLGIWVDDASSNQILNIVSHVNDDGPSVGKILVGDQIIKVNGVDVHLMSAAAISNLFAEHRNNEKIITIARTVHKSKSEREEARQQEMETTTVERSSAESKDVDEDHLIHMIEATRVFADDEHGESLSEQGGVEPAIDLESGLQNDVSSVANPHPAVLSEELNEEEHGRVSHTLGAELIDERVWLIDDDLEPPPPLAMIDVDAESSIKGDTVSKSTRVEQINDHSEPTDVLSEELNEEEHGRVSHTFGVELIDDDLEAPPPLAMIDKDADPSIKGDAVAKSTRLDQINDHSGPADLLPGEAERTDSILKRSAVSTNTAKNINTGALVEPAIVEDVDNSITTEEIEDEVMIEPNTVPNNDAGSSTAERDSRGTHGNGTPSAVNITTAWTVEDEEEDSITLLHAEVMPPWYRQRPAKRVLLFLFAAFSVTVAGLGVGLGLGKDQVIPSMAPSIAISLRPSTAPSDVPSQFPTPFPTVSQLPSMSIAPTSLFFKLIADDAEADDRFGVSVAVYDNYALVGAQHKADYGEQSGAAYVYVRDEVYGEWMQQTKLLAPDGKLGDKFGVALALYGDTAVIGSPLDDDMGDDSGSAHVFLRDGNEWKHEAKLLANNGEARDEFGSSVAIHNNTILVGAHGHGEKGTAYAFVQNGEGNWTFQDLIVSPGGESGDQFGASISIFGNTALIGADEADGSKGTAHIFIRDTGGWRHQAKLLNPNGIAGDNFGSSVALYEDTALVGADRSDDKGSDSGSAFIFVRDRAGNWNLQATLSAPDGTSKDLFGDSVDLHGDIAIIGAPQHAGAEKFRSGAVYVFKRIGMSMSKWKFQRKFVAFDGQEKDRLGTRVSVSNHTLLVGSPRDDKEDGNGIDAGSAYVWEI